MTIGDKLKALGADKVHARLGDTISLREKPLWEGPNGNGPNGGITYSTLSRFLVCRERFRLYMMEGFRSEDKFNHRLEYGNMWHICEESIAGWCQWNIPPWQGPLGDYARNLCRKYPYEQAAIDHWYNVCKVQFPIYFYYWNNKKEDAEVTPLLQEQVFDVQYGLPSGRLVRLRGKWDSVDLVGEGNETGIWLQENKTKGDIREGQIKKQLHFDLQTLLYLVALTYRNDGSPGLAWLDSNLPPSQQKVLGVRYNVVKRPLSGGKGTIVRKKGTKKLAPETKEHYYSRVADVIKSDPQSYFMRWDVEIIKKDIVRFREECLDPILEQLCDWYDEVNPPAKQNRSVNYSTPLNWRHPFGVWNVLDNGGSSDYDEYLATGSLIELRRVDRLFEELL